MNMLTVKEASRRLRVSTATVYQLCANGSLPHVRIGIRRGTIRITEHDLDDFVKGCSSRSLYPRIERLKHIRLGR